MDESKFLSECATVRTGRYSMSLEESMILMERTSRFTGIVYAFNYGFLRGREAERNGDALK